MYIWLQKFALPFLKIYLSVSKQIFTVVHQIHIFFICFGPQVGQCVYVIETGPVLQQKVQSMFGQKVKRSLPWQLYDPGLMMTLSIYLYPVLEVDVCYSCGVFIFAHGAFGEWVFKMYLIGWLPMKLGLTPPEATHEILSLGIICGRVCWSQQKISFPNVWQGARMLVSF